ncbi:MAG: hypothetical protein E6J41_12315 [Chloroflexi bacterium]|nr:MAG: hypothetical protein E6J41_12315 [Chloroflexota bacterium]
MNAQVILGKAMFTIRGADHLEVEGELVQIQRSGPNGFETVAVAGEDMLVTIEPAEHAKVEVPEKAGKAALDGHHWHPVGDPLD